MQVYEISHGDVKLVQEVDLSKISNIIKIKVLHSKNLAQNVRTECSLDLECPRTHHKLQNIFCAVSVREV